MTKPMHQARLESLLAARSKVDLPKQVLEQAFPKQREFIENPSKRKAAFVLRRGGKSYALAIYLIHACLSKASAKALYMGLTKDSAENVMWLNILEPLLYKLDIPHTFNKTKRLITFKNKSTIQLTGADATEAQITKYLGGKYILAVFDECQDIKHDLKHWIEDMLGPAMVDYGGTICTAGTAGRSIGRYWYDITQPESHLTSWHVSRWGAEDNPQMKELLLAEIERLKEETPGIEKTEGFRNQYLCEWVLDNTQRVYHQGEHNILKDDATIASLISADTKWIYILGFDFGFEDDTAFVVAAWNKYDNCMYIVETFKKKGMLTEEVASKLYELKAKYRPIYMVGDCQNKVLVETLRAQYRLPLMPSYKLGKEAHIAAMNSDFTINKIKVIKHMNEPLIKEWASLIWDEKQRAQGKFKEMATKDNHAADACLYLHHFSKHYQAMDLPVPDPNPYMTAAENRLKRQLDMYNEASVGDDYSIYDQMDTLRLIGKTT